MSDASRENPLLRALRTHWPEYLIEGAGLGAFMVSAVTFAWLLFHPGSPLARFVPEGTPGRFLMGLAMGGTAAAIVHSRFGKRSGAHLNPALTLTFLRLGRVQREDALFYALAQTLGAVLGVALARAVIGPAASGPPIELAATLPGESGLGVAFAAEAAISFVLMFAVLFASNHRALASKTGWIAASLVCLYITFEAPLSGMSMNPARTLGSALIARRFDALWVYFIAPPLGMLLAAEAYVRAFGPGSVLCAKLLHRGARSCIFVCRFREDALRGGSPRSAELLP